MSAFRGNAPRVLVLDAQYCHALAAIRSLGRRGLHVTGASHKPRAEGLHSRHCAVRLACPNPNHERRRYTEWLLQTLRAGKYEAALCFEAATKPHSGSQIELVNPRSLAPHAVDRELQHRETVPRAPSATPWTRLGPASAC